MPDDKKIRGPQDSTRINPNEDYEVAYWTKALNITPEQLKEAVREAGPQVEDVKKYLARKVHE